MSRVLLTLLFISIGNVHAVLGEDSAPLRLRKLQGGLRPKAKREGQVPKESQAAEDDADPDPENFVPKVEIQGNPSYLENLKESTAPALQMDLANLQLTLLAEIAQSAARERAAMYAVVKQMTQKAAQNNDPGKGKCSPWTMAALAAVALCATALAAATLVALFDSNNRLRTAHGKR